MVYKKVTVRYNDVIMDFTMTNHEKGNGHVSIYDGRGTFYDEENIYKALKTIEGDRINLFVRYDVKDQT